MRQPINETKKRNMQTNPLLSPYIDEREDCFTSVHFPFEN
jgi:hypothetical protein